MKPDCLDPKWRAILLYGPDSGLVRERVAAILRALVEQERAERSKEDK